MANSPDRIVRQCTPTDRDNLSITAAGLRSTDRPFPTRSDCLRHALATLAAVFAAPGMAAPVLVSGYPRKVAPIDKKACPPPAITTVSPTTIGSIPPCHYRRSHPQTPAI